MAAGCDPPHHRLDGILRQDSCRRVHQVDSRGGGRYAPEAAADRQLSAHQVRADRQPLGHGWLSEPRWRFSRLRPVRASATRWRSAQYRMQHRRLRGDTGNTLAGGRTAAQAVVRAPRFVGTAGYGARRRAAKGLAPTLDAEGRGKTGGPRGESERREPRPDPALAFIRVRGGVWQA